MSKRNYEAMARILGRSHDLDDAIKHITLYFAFDNSRFDTERFTAAVAKHRAEARGVQA